jgi:hypothetical protein
MNEDATAASGASPYLGAAQAVVGKLIAAFGMVNDDEAGVLAALQIIPAKGGKPVYDEVIKLIKTSPNVKAKFGKNFSLVSTLIKEAGISNPGYDKSQASPTHNPLRGTSAMLADEDWTPKYEAILTKYNPEETDFTEDSHW